MENSMRVPYKGGAIEIHSIDEPKENWGIESGKNFVVMLSTTEMKNLDSIRSFIKDLLALGCVEFCCVGEGAETVHNLIDEMIEDSELFAIVTTSHEDLSEGCDYFLHAAGGCEYPLVCLGRDYEQLAATITSALA